MLAADEENVEGKAIDCLECDIPHSRVLISRINNLCKILFLHVFQILQGGMEYPSAGATAFQDR